MSRRRRLRGDSGVTMLEAAVIAPLLLTIVLGIVEFGVVFRDYLTAGDAVGDAARVGSVLGNQPSPSTPGANADFEIVKRVREATSAIPIGQIDRIVIYKAGPASQGSPQEQVPAACKTGGGVSGVCTVFTDVNQAFTEIQAGNTTYFDCTTGCWDPATRDDGPNPNDIDYVGVYVQIDKQMITGLFGDTMTISAASVARIEPGQA